MRPGRKVYTVEFWTPELMTQRLMSVGFDVRVSCKRDLWRFEATREKRNYMTFAHVVFIRNGNIVLPTGEI